MDSTKINSEQNINFVESHIKKNYPIFAMVKATQILSFFDLFH